MQYPIIDEALTHTFTALLARCYSGDTSTHAQLNWLSDTFATAIECHGKCYKF